MSLKKLMKGVPSDQLPAEGLLTRDDEAVTPCQVACIKKLGLRLQIEQEKYLLEHPEVFHSFLPLSELNQIKTGPSVKQYLSNKKKSSKSVHPIESSEVNAMLKIFMSKMIQKNKRKGILKEAADYFTKNTDELKLEIFENLISKHQDDSEQVKLPSGSTMSVSKLTEIKEDIRALIASCYEAELKEPSTPSLTTLNTESSSFLSILTSDTTLSTPEPIPTPEPTVSETFYGFVSNTVDKAIFLRVDDQALNYDTAYIELMKAVEEAMEIPVTDIKLDIVELFDNSYKMFEFVITEKERIAAEIAWEKRMRKKMKRTLRRLNNFKGYETPPTPKSEISSHESYKIPPPRPCKCHPQFKYNRYPKDRFGIYLPSQEKYSDHNVTVTPEISEPSDDEQEDKAT